MTKWFRCKNGRQSSYGRYISSLRFAGLTWKYQISNDYPTCMSSTAFIQYINSWCNRVRKHVQYQLLHIPVSDSMPTSGFHRLVYTRAPHKLVRVCKSVAASLRVGEINIYTWVSIGQISAESRLLRLRGRFWNRNWGICTVATDVRTGA